MLTAREALHHLDRTVEDATIAVQGYGNAGSTAAKLLDDLGATIVAASDSSGAIYAEDGFDARDAKAHKAETGALLGYADADEEMTNEDLLTMDVDVLVPAALENAIDADLAEDVQAALIVEAADA